MGDSRLNSIEKGTLKGQERVYDVYREDRPTCSLGCPAGVDIKAYVNLIGDKRYEEAVAVIRQANPFPGICGRVCTHPCESQCGRSDIDQAVSIRALKRFAADYELSRKSPMGEVPKSIDKSVAIIGSGPAGLTAAVDLVLSGVPVTVFEEGTDPGGLLSWGIPDFRLPKNIVRNEIKDIVSLGVEIRPGERVDKPLDLLEQGYSSVILAMGCQSPIMPKIENANSQGVIDCLRFLRMVSQGEGKNPGRTIVIGGGNAALDSARTAVRLGAEVTVAYRRTREEMPAEDMEIAHAEEEGIDFQYLAIPVQVIAENEKAVSIKFQRAELGEPDDSGRRRPVPIPEEYFTLNADTIILALGSRPDKDLLPPSLKITEWGTLEVYEHNMTSQPGIFGAGDIISGPSTIVDAIGSGHCAANGVLKHLGIYGEYGAASNREMLIVEERPAGTLERIDPECVPAASRQSTFDEVELGMHEKDAIQEANRCRRCGSCMVCSVCLSVCDYRNAVITIMESGEEALAKIPFSIIGADDEWTLQDALGDTNVNVEPIIAEVDESICIACGRCEDSCPYKAIRTVFDVSGNVHSQVDAGACRGCGACAGTCPTGAIQMGYTGNEKLFPSARKAAQEAPDKVVRFKCLWNDFNPGLERKPGEVLVQCTRRLSPGIIMEALASGAKAVDVQGCADDECHYLPGPWMGPDIVESCRNMLQSIGIDEYRVAYSDGNVPSTFPQNDSFIDNAHNLPDTKPPMGRCLNAAQVLMAQPDYEPEKPQGKLMLGMGCLAMSEPVFDSYGFPRPGILNSAKGLLDMAGIDFSPAPGIHISGSNLKEWGMGDLYEAYSDSIIEAARDSDGLIVPTPKTYKSMVELYGEVFEVFSLPEILLDGLEGRFPESNMTIAYHRSCADGGEFDKHCLDLLSQVSGLKVIEIEGECGDTGWRFVGSGSRTKGAELLNKVEEAGATILVSSSTRCTMHLDALKSGWCQSSVEVKDFITFIAELLGVGQ